MQYIIGVLLGIICGMGIAGLMAVKEINKKERKTANLLVMIKNRDILIERQRKILTAIKSAVNKKYFTVEKLKNEIKELFTDANQDK